MEKISISDEHRTCLELTARILIRAFWLGFAALMLCFIVVLAGKNLAFKVHETLFGVTREQFILINYPAMGLLKLLVFGFFLLPYIAIRWVLKGVTVTS